MRVFLAGATGAVGRCLLPRLVRDGHEVTAMTRSPDRADWIRSLGAQPVVCDVFRKDELFRAVQAARPEVVIHQLTRIPARINPRHIARDLATTNRLRTEGTFALVEAAQAAGARRFIAQSVAFFYNPNERTPVPEDDPLDSTIPGAGEIVDALRVHEHVVLGASRMEAVVLRYGQFYGPGTFYASDGSFAEDVRRRRVPVVGEGGGVFSFVHVDDAAAAAALAVTSTEPGIYNIVDDEPMPVAEWLPDYARLLDAPAPFKVPEFVARLAAGPYGRFVMTRQRGASNHKAKQQLGWSPRFRSWKDGFQQRAREEGHGEEGPGQVGQREVGQREAGHTGVPSRAA